MFYSIWTVNRLSPDPPPPTNCLTEYIKTEYFGHDSSYLVPVCSSEVIMTTCVIFVVLSIVTLAVTKSIPGRIDTPRKDSDKSVQLSQKFLQDNSTNSNSSVSIRHCGCVSVYFQRFGWCCIFWGFFFVGMCGQVVVVSGYSNLFWLQYIQSTRKLSNLCLVRKHDSDRKNRDRDMRFGTRVL